MIIELTRTYNTISIPCGKDDYFESDVLQNAGYMSVPYKSIQDWESIGLRAHEVGKLWNNPNSDTLYINQGWHGLPPNEYIQLEEIARILPSTKFDLGTRTIELTDAEIFHLKCEFEHIGMKEDIRQKWDDLTADGEIPEDLNPDISHLLELVESRQTGDFTYNDAYWRTIEDAIEDYLTEMED